MKRCLYCNKLIWFWQEQANNIEMQHIACFNKYSEDMIKASKKLNAKLKKESMKTPEENEKIRNQILEETPEIPKNPEI